MSETITYGLKYCNWKLEQAKAVSTRAGVSQARPLLTRAIEDGNYDTLVDPKLQRDYNIDDVPRIVACAAACMRHSVRLKVVV